MIFASHNFTENFLNAVGYDDSQMETMIIIDEIARLLVDDKKAVVEQLRKSGINVSYKDNPEIIKAYLIHEIESGNQNILNFLSRQIILNQLDEPTAKNIVTKFSADSKSKAGQILSGVAKNEQVQEGIADLISSGISKAFSKKNSQKVSNENQLSERLKASQMVAAQNKKSKYGALKVVLIVSAVAGIGYAIYRIIKNRNSSGSEPVSNVTPPAPTIIEGHTPINQ